MLSAKEAATAVGMTKAGIIRSIHTGKLSATRSDNGQFVIDPAELFRVYDPLTDGVNGHGNIDREVSTAGNFAPKIDSNGAVLHEDTWLTQLTLLERIIRSHEETIADLQTPPRCQHRPGGPDGGPSSHSCSRPKPKRAGGSGCWVGSKENQLCQRMMLGKESWFAGGVPVPSVACGARAVKVAATAVAT